MIDQDKKRKNSNNNNNKGRATKKQKINDYQTIEITKKTSYNKQQEDVVADPQKTPFGPKDISIEESFFISNDEIFKKIQEKEIKKYQDSLIINPENKKKNKSSKKLTNDLVNKMNITLSDLLNNNNDDEMSEETEEGSSSQSSVNNMVTLYNSNDSDNEDSDINSPDNDSMTTDDIVRIRRQGIFNECFLCSWGNSEHDAIYSKNLEELKDMYMRLRPYTREEDLANMLHLYFMDKVWKPDSNMPILTPSMALEHIRNIGKTHTLNATEHIIDSIRLWSRVRDNLQYSMYHQDNKADKDQFNCLMNTQKILNSLYTMNIPKMLFKDPDCTINITRGPVFNIESLNENTEKIIKTKKITQTNIKRHKTIDI